MTLALPKALKFAISLIPYIAPINFRRQAGDPSLLFGTLPTTSSTHTTTRDIRAELEVTILVS
jgi:hypothetical protein